MTPNEWITFGVLCLTAVGLIWGGIWRMGTRISEKFTKVYDKIEDVKKSIEDKLEKQNVNERLHFEDTIQRLTVVETKVINGHGRRKSKVA